LSGHATIWTNEFRDRLTRRTSRIRCICDGHCGIQHSDSVERVDAWLIDAAARRSDATGGPAGIRVDDLVALLVTELLPPRKSLFE
jgi:hypothetical protein